MERDIEIRETEGRGRGVFARRDFRTGEVIEEAPVIVLDNDQYELLNRTVLRDYYFDWGEHSCAIPLGYSLIYNHSNCPNAMAARDRELGTIRFLALQDIAAGQEILHRYECGPWFDVR
ncbi:MAG: SET domain-containing protein [Candidatus Krumholzibacteria bacterium]|nr:SET domain-containing protein [Candidatus Krumholzibacteria bacterium]